MSARRDDLLAGAIRYLEAEGVANFSLRPMAQALDTSARMLLFHFGSKNGLVQAVIEALTTQLQDSFRAQARTGAGESLPLKRFWDWAKQPQVRKGLKLLYESQMLAARDPAVRGGYLDAVAESWQAVALDALAPPFRTPAMATLCVAVFDGLFLQLMTSGEVARLDAAMEAFIALAAAAREAEGPQ